MRYHTMTPREHARIYNPINDPYLFSDIRHAYRIRNDSFELVNGAEKTEAGKQYCKSVSRFVLRIKLERVRILREHSKLPEQK